MDYFVGSNSKQEQAGIYRITLSEDKIADVKLLQALPFATWLDFDVARQQLLATRTNRDGHLFAYTYKDGALQALADAPAQGAACYVCRHDRHLFVANYGTGTVSTYQLANDELVVGKTFQHSGSSIHEKRQTAPHAHQIVMSPDKKWALSCDLGCDAIYVYPFAAETGLAEPHAVAVPKAGSGPRHLCFHPSEPYLYSLNELAGSLDVWDWDTATGKMKALFHLDLPGEQASDIRWCDRFLYAGLRSNNKIAVIDAHHPREPQLIDAYAVQGRPRGFTVTDDKRFVLVGNEREDALELIERDLKTGALGAQRDRVTIPAPVCVCSLTDNHQRAVYGI